MALFTDSLREDAESLLAELARVADDAAVLLTRSDSVMVKLAEGRVSVSQNWSDYEVSIYVARKRRLLVTSFGTRRLGEAKQRVKALAENLDMLQESEYYAPLPERREEVRDDTKYSHGVLELVEDPRPLLDDLYGALDKNNSGKAAGMLQAEAAEGVLVTTGGFVGHSLASKVNGYLRVFGERTSGQWSFTGVAYEPRLLETMVEKASHYSRLSLPYTSIEPSRVNVVLTPMVLGNFTDYVMGAASAMAVDMGMSFLVGKKPGDRVASEVFTLRDVPREKSLPGGGNYDAEGVETRDKPVVEKGVLRTLLHNTKTAKKHSTETTGNAGWLMPHAFNIAVDPGDWDEEELQREMRRGLIVTNNWYTRLQNYLAGQFSTVARDAVIWVEDGEPRALVRKMRIADTFPHILENIRALSRHQYPIEWWEVETPSLLPYALVEGVQVTSRM